MARGRNTSRDPRFGGEVPHGQCVERSLCVPQSTFHYVKQCRIDHRNPQCSADACVWLLPKRSHGDEFIRRNFLVGCSTSKVLKVFDQNTTRACTSVGELFWNSPRFRPVFSTATPCGRYYTGTEGSPRRRRPAEGPPYARTTAKAMGPWALPVLCPTPQSHRGEKCI